jgi:hypothetical protein
MPNAKATKPVYPQRMKFIQSISDRVNYFINLVCFLGFAILTKTNQVSAGAITNYGTAFIASFSNS